VQGSASEGKFYNADPFIFLFVGMVILIFGPGKFSLDALVPGFVGHPKVREATMPGT
jgi:hypothetical protein